MNRYDPRLDPMFQRPVIDVDEWRERFLPDGTRILYRYMQGGFDGTGVRFSFLLPEKDRCARRFHQCLTPAPVPQRETVGREAAFALRSGALYVESTQEGESPWKASAATADMARRKAKEIYGPSRFYGYVYGGEGSAHRALACIENSSAWDGAALMMPGTGAILFDAGGSDSLTLKDGAVDLPRTLTALEDWVERGVRPS